jgi:hypothetical protein
VVTTLFVVLAFFNQLNQIVGGVLIAIFALYIVSIIYAIYEGVASPLELSNSDSDGFCFVWSFCLPMTAYAHSR